MTRGHSCHRQIPLAMQLRDEATLDNFLVVAAVEPLLCTLRGQLLDDGEAMIFLFGPAGAGKTHLLQAACHLAGAGAQYLPLADLRDCAAQDVLHGLEMLDLVCLDDLHCVLGDAAWELALFNLCNRAREKNCRLLVAANAAPRALPVDLPDLRSRLAWGIVYQLQQASDEEKSAILRLRATRRGLSLPAEVATYIVSRASRGTGDLLDLLDALDHASLREQRALSIPFVKQSLGW